jgi:hypothetical protein
MYSNTDFSWPDNTTVYWTVKRFAVETTTDQNFPPWMTNDISSAAYAWDGVAPANGCRFNYLDPASNFWRLAPMGQGTQGTTGITYDPNDPYTITQGRTYVNSFYNWYEATGPGLYLGLLATELFDYSALDLPTIARHEWGHWIHLADIPVHSGDIMQAAAPSTSRAPSAATT